MRFSPQKVCSAWREALNNHIQDLPEGENERIEWLEELFNSVLAGQEAEREACSDSQAAPGAGELDRAAPRMEMHQRIFRELARAMVTLHTPRGLVAGMAYRLGRYLQADRCYISLEDLENDRRVIYTDYHRCLPGLAGVALVSELPAAVAAHLQRGRPVAVVDITRDPLTVDAAAGIFERQQILSFIAIPWLNREGKWSGTITVGSREPRVWQNDEIDLLQSVADMVSLGLENAGLFQDLREFRRRFEVALRNAPIAVFSTDRDLVCTWTFNPGSILNIDKMLGLRLDGASDAHGGETPRLAALLRQVIACGEGMRQEIQLPVRGQRMTFDLTIEPLRDASGQVSGLTCAALEITRQRQMEAEARLNLAHIEVQHRLIQEREQERMRIARDLHDGPLQDLIAANFLLVEAMDIKPREAQLEKMQALQRAIYKQIQDLRHFCNDLRPPALGPFGLGKTIHAHLEGVRARNPELSIHEELDVDERVLTEELRMTLFQAYQELLNNVLRHSQAKQVTVRFHLSLENALLEVEDDGVGFNAPGDWVELAREGHLGLVGLRERVEMSGGTVEFFTHPGKGTLVRVIVPRRRNAPEA